jgi:hypothetical protein
MKRYSIRMAELSEPKKYPATFALWRDLLALLKR